MPLLWFMKNVISFRDEFSEILLEYQVDAMCLSWNYHFRRMIIFGLKDLIQDLVQCPYWVRFAMKLSNGTILQSEREYTLYVFEHEEFVVQEQLTHGRIIRPALYCSSFSEHSNHFCVIYKIKTLFLMLIQCSASFLIISVRVKFELIHKLWVLNHNRFTLYTLHITYDLRFTWYILL